MKKLIVILSLVLTLTFIVEFFPYRERKVYSELIRLHILANSGNEEDIALKYEVRDAVLKESENIFIKCETPLEARETMEETGSRIEKIANSVLESNGKTYRAKAIWGRETYPERTYDHITLPAGEYYSLRILLGEGTGENWWCVLFPPLCIGASAAEEEMKSVGIEGDAFKTFTSKSIKYKFKFKLLEWLFG
jgi:stage II sporulation protein R